MSEQEKLVIGQFLKLEIQKYDEHDCKFEY